jgi:hypothetical protein
LKSVLAISARLTMRLYFSSSRHALKVSAMRVTASSGM